MNCQNRDRWTVTVYEKTVLFWSVGNSCLKDHETGKSCVRSQYRFDMSCSRRGGGGAHDLGSLRSLLHDQNLPFRGRDHGIFGQAWNEIPRSVSLFFSLMTKFVKRSKRVIPKLFQIRSGNTQISGIAAVHLNCVINESLGATFDQCFLKCSKIRMHSSNVVR